MASIGKVAAVFTASTSGLTSGIKTASDAFRGLGGDAGSLNASLSKIQSLSFESLRTAGPAATAASEAFASIIARAESLTASLQSGAISAESFRDSMAALTQEASRQSQIYSAGAATTAQFATAQDRFAAASASLNEQLAAGAISVETYGRAMSAARDALSMADGSEAAAAAAAADLAAVQQRGAAITAQFASAQSVYADAVSELNQLLAAGAISQETYARASEAALNALSQADGSAAAAAASAERLDAIMRQGASTTAQFATAEEQFATATASLREQLAAGAISSETFSRAMESARTTLAEADGSAAAAAASAERLDAIMRQGASTTAQFATAEEQFATATASLREQLAAGAISSETFSRAMESARTTLAEADGSAAASRAAMESLNETMRRGQAVTNANRTAQEKYGAELADLRGLLAAGAINQRTFDRAVAAATSSLKRAEGASKDAASGFSSLTSRLNALIAIEVAKFFTSIVSTVAGAVRSLVSFGQAQAQVIDDSSKMAARLGMTYGEFAGLSLAADLAGVSMDSIAAASQKAEIAFARAAGGSATARAAFANLGLSIDDLNKLSASDRFDAIASSIAALPNEAQRAAAAVQIFGRSGAELLPLFSGGAEGIAEARAQAERLGLALSTSQGRDVEAMNDSFTMVSKTIQGIIQQVEAYLSPAVTAIANTFVDFVGEIGGANIGQAIGEGIIAGAKYLAIVADEVINGWRDMYFAAADALGVATSKEAKRLNDMQAQINAGMAPQVPVPGSGGFVTMVDPMFSSEVASLTEAVKQQRQSLSTFTNIVDRADQFIAAAVTRAQDDQKKSAPKPIEPPKPPIVINIDQALKGIDSRSKEGIAEMFRIMRGGAGDIQQQQLGVLEQIAENTAGGDDILSLEF